MARQIKVDVLQVVRACAAYLDAFHGVQVGWGRRENIRDSLRFPKPLLTGRVMASRIGTQCDRVDNVMQCVFR